MLRLESAWRAAPGMLLWFCAAVASGQTQAMRAPVTVSVIDENGVAVSDAQVTVTEPGQQPAHLRTDFAGDCSYTLQQQNPYQLHVEKPGFYAADASGIATSQTVVKVVLAHEQIVHEQVNVTASLPGIDTQGIPDRTTMNTPEIVEIPYQTSRDIRYLLPFFPGVVQDATAQVHVAGSETWETLDTLDGFDIRSPVGGSLSLRVSSDAVRSIDSETTRYPVEYGRATGGVLAFATGMGDNKFRFNVTNFIPSFREVNGIRFDKFVPRFTFSGPLERDRAWWYDAVEMEYNNIYISELPANADTDELIRGSNLLKFQDNLTAANILTAGLLLDNYHSPYDGISPLTPQPSTVKRNTIAWFPFLRDQQSLSGGGLLDLGIGYVRIRDGYEPRGNTPYEITPEMAEGSYFENLTGRSERLEGTAALYLPPRHWAGQHDVKMGLDLDHVGYNQDQSRTAVSYYREGAAPGEIGTLDRQSVFAAAPPFRMHNGEIGAYIQDRWQPAKGWLPKGLLLEPGLRFDWDEIVRRALVAPRLAAVYAPPGDKDKTKISAGIGLYYEHTQLEYLAQTFAGVRADTYYQVNGVTPVGPAEMTEFTANQGALHAPRALNWSVGVERALPWSIMAGANFMQKRTTDVWTFANQGGAASAGDYRLTNEREDRYSSEEIDARRLFANGYTVYMSYTHSSARTNAALDYLPTPSPLGPQQSGPLAWDTPNRAISWGWLPVPMAMLRKQWDLVYLLDWHNGYPYTAVNAAQQVVGAAGAQRFPDYVNFSPGVEWKFHFRGQYWGLRGVIENATGSENPAVVNNVVDSPEYGTFSEYQGRAFTARIRLIGAK
ncbi:MAG TPA: TonB-dependent receptor [Terracidiphilus sp.]|nr:TonB-dependent receptor [Terracidiphilus sp.]